MQRDPRFRAIDERDREDVYQEFIEKLGEQERENKLLQSKQRIEQLREEFRSENTITLETRWKDIDAIVESRKAVKPLYNEATPMEYLTAFEDTIKELEHENAMQKKQERRRAERKNRERYVDLLRRLFEARLVNQRTRWRDLVNGFDPASIPGMSPETIQRMEI